MRVRKLGDIYDDVYGSPDVPYTPYTPSGPSSSLPNPSDVWDDRYTWPGSSSGTVSISQSTPPVFSPNDSRYLDFAGKVIQTATGAYFRYRQQSNGMYYPYPVNQYGQPISGTQSWMLPAAIGIAAILLLS